MKIAIVTDSTSSLTKQEIKNNDIKIIPIPIIIEGKSYYEFVDITSDKLFELQRNGASFPKTSQPSMGKVIELFDKLHDEGYDAIIAITLAGTISGFYETLQNIAHNYPQYNLYPYDSKITIRLQGYMALAAAKMVRLDYTPEQIISKLDEIRKTIDEVFVVDDLNNLSRGGRLSNAGAFVGTLLQIKPLLTFDDKSDKIVAFDKVRSMKRAIKKAEQITVDRVNAIPYKDKLRFLVVNSNDAEQASGVKEFLNQNFPNNTVEMTEFDPVVATHLGEKSIGMTWMIDINKITY